MPVPSFGGGAVGKAARGKLSGKIAGLPVGGSYKLDFQLLSDTGSVLEKHTVSDILVGDLWLLAGQSNMQGYGYFPSAVPAYKMVRNFYMDCRWDIAREPLHNLAQAAAPVHGGNPAAPKIRKPLRGVGPGQSFALEMFRNSGVPQGTLACAHGGTSMDNWNPKRRKEGGNSLYGAVIEAVQNAGGRIAGVVWHQGCTDSDTDAGTRGYEKKTRALFAALRRDLKSPKLPIVFAQLSEYVTPRTNGETWTVIRNAQYRIGLNTPYTACVPTIDLELDDGIHLSSKSQERLGKRFARAMLYLLGMPSGVRPITVKKVSVAPDPASGYAVVTIEFANVNGRLTAPGRAFGFTPVTNDLLPASGCYRTDLDGKKAIVHTTISCHLIDYYQIAYGAGFRPHCAVADAAGTPVPCFVHSIRPGKCRFTPLVSDAETCTPVPGPETLDALALPDAPEKLDFSPARFFNFYLSHPQLAKFATPEAKVFYFRFKLEVKKTAKLRLLAGSDGPFAVFCDGRELLRRETTNPLLPDKFRSDFTADAGIHEFYFAMSSHAGMAWGVVCRFQLLSGGELPLPRSWRG